MLEHASIGLKPRFEPWRLAVEEAQDAEYVVARLDSPRRLHQHDLEASLARIELESEVRSGGCRAAAFVLRRAGCGFRET